FIKQQKIDYGQTGRIAFDDNGDRIYAEYDILNVKSPRKIESVGQYVYSPDIKKMKLLMSDSNIVWPGDLKHKPEGFLIPTHLKVLTIEEKPFVYARKKKSGECREDEILCPYYKYSSSMKDENEKNCCRGYCIDLLRELSKTINFTYSLYLSSDGEFGSYSFQNTSSTKKEWTGLIAEIVYEKADMIVAPLTINPERAEFIEFSKPFKYQGITILEKKPSRSSTLVSFLQPFSNTLWILVMVSVHVVALVLYLLDRFSPFGRFRMTNSDNTEEDALNLSSAIWFAWGVLLNSGIGEGKKKRFVQDEEIVRTSRRISGVAGQKNEVETNHVLFKNTMKNENPEHLSPLGPTIMDLQGLKRTATAHLPGLPYLRDTRSSVLLYSMYEERVSVTLAKPSRPYVEIPTIYACWWLLNWMHPFSSRIMSCLALLSDQWNIQCFVKHRDVDVMCTTTPTRRLRHYRSGLRALRRGRRPRQRGSVAQPEQHDLSASRAASRRGAGEIHSRAAEQGRGGARRQALLPDHMSGEEVPSARQQFEGGDRADAFQGARIPDGRARPARHVLRSDRLVDYVYYPLEPAEYWWQLEEQLSQELDGIDVIFGNLLAPLSSCSKVAMSYPQLNVK
ncbi:unnamed protein product, partial [Trichogramma brassicae]